MTTVLKLKVYPDLSARDAAKVKTRADVAGEGNATSSLKDAAFTDFRNDTVEAADAERLGDWNFRLQRTLPFIEAHVEKRVALLFIQAVVCHLSPHRFKEGHTIHQGYHAKTLEYQGEKHRMQAAHSATIPCLVAKDAENQKENVFLYRSHVYDENNSTIDMDVSVNNADRAIDEKYTTSKLRDKAIALLNRTAGGSITPVDTAKLFVTALIEEIDVALQREKDNKVKDVLRIYREEGAAIAEYLEDPESFDRMLSLDLKDPEDKALTQTVHELKAGEDTDREEVLKLIKKKIDEVPFIIRQKLHEEHNISQTPVHFYALYHVWLLRCFSEDDIEIVEEALGINRQTLYAQASKFKHIEKTNNLLSENAEKITAVAREVMTLTAHLRGEDVDLSELNGLSPEKQASLRPAIFQLQYKIIQVSQSAESAIKSKIEDTYHKIKKESAAVYMEPFFYKAILDRAALEGLEKPLSKLLNISRFTLAGKIRELKCDSNAHKILENYAEMISSLAKSIRGISVNSTGEEKLALQNQILAVHDLINPGKARTLALLFYKRLYEQNEKPAAKNLLQEILPYSEESLDRHILQCSKQQNAEVYLANHAAHIQAIMTLADTKITDLKKESAVFRRELFVELLTASGLKEKEFQAKYKKIAPGAPMSNGTLYNLKYGIKYLESVIIERICNIFGQNKSLFYPSNFADRQAS